MAFPSSNALSQTATTIFRGTPSVKVSEGGIERMPEAISPDRGANLQCVISRIGDAYYWASRENTELVRIDSGAFTTYVALSGAGYVRVIRPEQKQAAALASPTEASFDYVEHVVVGLRSITYYGKVQ